MMLQVWDFIVEYLEELAKNPAVKHFHPIKGLENAYFHHNPDEHKISGSEAATKDRYLIGENRDLRHAVPPSLEDYTNRETYPILHEEWNGLYRTNSIHLKSVLHEDYRIQTLGEKRGRVFGHVTARPTLSDNVVSEIIYYLLKGSTLAHTWESLYPTVFTVLQSIHAKGNDIAISNPELCYDPQKNKKSAKKVRNNHSGIKAEKLVIEMPKLDPSDESGYGKWGTSTWESTIWQSHIQETSDKELTDWIAYNYSEKWFKRATSNIQRDLKKKEGVTVGTGSNGLKRGLWQYHKYSVNEDLKQVIETRFKDLRNAVRSMDKQNIQEVQQLEYLLFDLTSLTKEIEYRINMIIDKSN